MKIKYKQKASNVKKLEEYIIKLKQKNGTVQDIRINSISK